MDRKVQIRVLTTSTQAEALERASKRRNLSKQALLREGIEAVTGVSASEISNYPPAPGRGFADPNHPMRNRKRSEETTTTEEAEAVGAG